jgi:hypothetical protein
MMRVYLLYSTDEGTGTDDGSTLSGVFSSREAAEFARSELESHFTIHHPQPWYIKEHLVDNQIYILKEHYNTSFRTERFC